MSTSYLWYLGWLLMTAIVVAGQAVVEATSYAEPLGAPVMLIIIFMSPIYGLGAVFGLGLVRYVERVHHLRPLAAGTVGYALTALGVAVACWFLMFR